MDEDIDLTQTCPNCANPNIIKNRKGQIVCRDCGTISPAGEVVRIGIYERIKRVIIPKTKKKKKPKRKKPKKTKKKKLKIRNIKLKNLLRRKRPMKRQKKKPKKE